MSHPPTTPPLPSPSPTPTPTQRTAHAITPKEACDYRDRLCALQERFAFGAAVVGDTAYFSGGLNTSAPTYPVPGSQLEAFDIPTATPLVLQTLPDAALNTTRYRQQLVPWGDDKLIMVGGQFDDQNGASKKTMSMIVLDLATRAWSLRREFWQSNGGERGRFAGGLGVGGLALGSERAGAAVAHLTKL